MLFNATHFPEPRSQQINIFKIEKDFQMFNKTHFSDQAVPHHDKVPNLKLVMNPEGKLHDWTDMPDEEIPELQQIASGGPSAEIAHNVVENLQTCKGRGKTVERSTWQPQQQQLPQQQQQQQQQPKGFASSFRQVFDSRRGLFEKNQVNDPIKFVETHKTQTNLFKPKIQFPYHTSPEPIPLSRSSTSPEDLAAASRSRAAQYTQQPQRLWSEQHSEALRQNQNLSSPTFEQGQQVQPIRPTFPLLPPSPSVPRRASSKMVLAQYKKPAAGTFAEEERTRPPLRSFFGYS